MRTVVVSVVTESETGNGGERMVRLELSAREAVVLDLLRKRSYREVARLFNVTVDAIKRIKESAKRKGW